MAPTTHVPKRAVQHSIFTPSQEVTPIALKPGQTELHFNGLYTSEIKVTTNCREKPALLQDSQNISEYANSINSATQVKDYVNTVRPRRFEEKEKGESKSAAHWRSEYAASSTEGASRMVTPRMTAAQILASRHMPIPRSCKPRGETDTCHLADFGRQGSDPRDKVAAGSTKCPLFKSSLTAGTHKGTLHPPGYQGFIPSYPGFSGALNRIEQGETLRSTDKTNIVQIFHKNLVGYAGHVPMSVTNELGPRKPSSLTIFDHDFQPHKMGM